MSLPTKTADFGEVSYWEKFLGDHKSFEWYGDWTTLSGTVEKYIRTTNAILQLGCGNSALADSLYDNGYRNVTSTDAAPTAIRQQIQRNSNARPTLVFEVADATKVRAAVADAACSIVQLPYADAAYNVVIEKGLLDALASASDDVCARMFAQVDRVLAVNGRYIVVSLAQQHVLTIWMKPYILRIIEIARSLDGTDNKAVFVMIATKLVIEYLPLGQKIERCDSSEEAVDKALAHQHQLRLRHSIRNSRQDQEILLNIYSSSGCLLFKLYLLDRDDCVHKLPCSFRAVLVPLGRERDYLYGTPHGRKSFLTNIGAERVAYILCVDTSRPEQYTSMENVQRVLSPVMLDLAPAAIGATRKHPACEFVSINVAPSSKRIACIDSAINGQIVIEDVRDSEEGPTMRRMRFGEHSLTIQSEAQVTYTTGKSKKGDRKAKVDHSTLTNEHHVLMLSALATALPPTDDRAPSVAILGFGAGLLGMFLRTRLTQWHVTGIELDRQVLDIGRAHFALSSNDDRMTVVEADAIEYMQKTDSLFDAILIDVAGSVQKAAVVCPLPSFLSSACLRSVRARLRPGGCVAYNVLCRDEQVAEEVMRTLASYYTHTVWVRTIEDVNRVVFCTNRSYSSVADEFCAQSNELLSRCFVDSSEVQLSVDRVHVVDNSGAKDCSIDLDELERRQNLIRLNMHEENILNVHLDTEL